jgi:hypothetical protein
MAIDRQLGSVVARLLVKDPDDRYQSAAHLLRALRDYNTAIADAPRGTTGRRRRRRAGRLALVAAAAAIVGGAGGGAFLMWNLLDEGGDAIAEETPFVVRTSTTTPVSTRSPTPGEVFGTRVAVSQATMTAAAIVIELTELPDALRTIAAEQTATIVARSPTATPTSPGGTFEPGPPSPAFGQTLEPGAAVEVVLTYAGIASGTTASLEIYVSSDLIGGGAARRGGTSGTVDLPSTTGAVTLSATYDAYAIPVTFCGIRVTVDGGTRSSGCAP